MKKIIYLMIFLLLLLSDTCIGIEDTEQNTTIYVDDDNIMGPWDGSQSNPYQTIQDAVDNSSEGDTIYVYEGRYNGNIIVTKTICLIGENKHDVTVIGGKHDFWIHADDVWIENFSIENSSRYFSAIYITSSGCTVKNNIIKNNFAGVFIDGGSSNKVINNLFLYNDDRSVRLEFTQFNSISNNYIGFGGDGIYCWSSSNNLIKDNTVDNCLRGIIIGDFSEENLMYHNNFYRNYYFNSAVQLMNNNWDNGMNDGGNFWDDYDGEDENNDGFGDTSYTFSNSGVDYFPLMNPWNKSKPTIIFSQGFGLTISIQVNDSKDLTTLVELIIENKQGFRLKNRMYEIIELSSFEKISFKENVFGLGLILIEVNIGPWSWEKQAVLIGPFVFILF